MGWGTGQSEPRSTSCYAPECHGTCLADTPDQAHSAAGLGHAGGRRSVCPQWRSRVLVFGCPDKAWSGSARARSMCRAHVVDHVEIQSSIGAVNYARQNNISLSTRYSHLERLQPDEFPPSGQGGVLSLVASTADDLAHVYVARYSRPKSRNAVSVRVKR
jgi:hypothetical protein